MPKTIVIEETNKSKARYPQKCLEFIHKSLLSLLEDTRFEVVYLNTSTWRKTLGQHATKEDIKNNAKVNKAKKEGKSKRELGLKR